jgi:DNA-directed RNA polymerase subunit M/transcription elongation factor TFIIS
MDTEGRFTYRDDMVKRIRDALASYPPLHALLEQDKKYRPHVRRFAVAVEQGFHRACLSRCLEFSVRAHVELEEFQIMYQSAAYSVLANLDCSSLINQEIGSFHLARLSWAHIVLRGLLPPEPKEVTDFLCNALVDPESLARLSPEHLNPLADRALREEYRDRERSVLPEAISSEYVCNSCGENRTKFRTVQKRRVDEAPSLLIRCVRCGHRWTLG